VFRDKDDAKYKQVVSWMDSALVQPEPDYGIHFSVPTPAFSTPATQPAGKEAGQ
jgi:hypothetical protein